MGETRSTHVGNEKLIQNFVFGKKLARGRNIC
jgi:hypothetical protein